MWGRKVSNLNFTLPIFEATSGLHINMLKSIINPVNVVPNLDEPVDIICYQIGPFPTTYMGLSLGAKVKPVGIWNGVIEKIKKNLATR